MFIRGKGGLLSSVYPNDLLMSLRFLRKCWIN